MKKILYLLIVCFSFLNVFSQPNAWINEFHYRDNGANEDNDFVEFVVESLGSYSDADFVVELYDAQTGKVYKSKNASSLMRMTSGNYTFFGWYTPMLDSNAAICLSYQGAVIQFISYNDYFTALDGAANGQISKLIRVSEDENTPTNYSIQLAGTGLNYISFEWQNPATNTYLATNNNQTFATAPWCYLAGDFNGWGADSLNLRKIEKNPTFARTFQFTGTTGKYEFKFRSSRSDWNYSWGRGDTVENAKQTTFYNNGANGKIALTNGKYYTFIMKRTDEGSDTYGSVIETSEVPTKIISVSHPDVPVRENTRATINITFNKEPNDDPADNYQECVYLEYSYDNWQSSTRRFVQSTNITGTSTSLSMPIFPAGTVIQYYVFTFPWYNFDNYSDIESGMLEFNNNNGNFYSYTVVAPKIKEAYQFFDNLGNPVIKLIYNVDMTGVTASDFVLNKNTDNISFSGISVNQDTIVLSSPSSTITSDLQLDTIYDNANNLKDIFYAGLLSIDKTNTANSPDTISQGFNATFTGIVTATNNKDSIWFQDNALPKHGILVYGEDIAQKLNLGDSAIFVGKKVITDNSTRIFSNYFKLLASGKTPDTVFVTPDKLEYDLTADNSIAEQYEGQLVFVPKVYVTDPNIDYNTDSLTNCDGYTVLVDDGVNYHYTNFVNAVEYHKYYNMTGVVTFNHGHYKINPRFQNDMKQISFDEDFMDGNGSYYQSENVIVSEHQDSSHAFKCFEYQLDDQGIDTLPLRISGFSLYTGPDNNSDFIRDIAGFYVLMDGNLINFSKYRKIDSNKITLYFNPDEFVIYNKTRVNIELYSWFTDTAKLNTVLQFNFNNTDYVTDDAPCSSSPMRLTGTAFYSSAFTLKNAAAIDEQNKNIQIYPNPAHNFVRFSGKVANVELFNTMGQKMNVRFENNEMNLSNIASGIYTARITMKNGDMLNKQIIKR